jgi:hypothetical protein
MTALDAKFGALAVKLLAKFGKNVQYSVIGAATYNPAAGRAVAASITTTVRAFVSRAAMGPASGFLANASSPLEENRREILIAGNAVAASQNDRIIVDGITYTVVQNSPVYSGETIALHVITAQQT